MPWLVGSNMSRHARLRLFCFPYAGGGAQTYRTWPHNLPDTVEVCAVELPGRGRRLREPPYYQLSSMVSDLLLALCPYLDKPFAFFGHSMGALISFELARMLRQRGWPEPAQIFVSARRSPQIPDIDPPTYNLPEDEFIAEIRRLNGTPHEVLEHPELLQLLIPILRADFAVCQTYAYVPDLPLSCPITAFGGRQDLDVLSEHLEAWREHTLSAFALHLLPGDHFFINAPQARLLQILIQELHRLVSVIARK